MAWGLQPAGRGEVPQAGTAQHAPAQTESWGPVGDQAAHRLATGEVKAGPASASANIHVKHLLKLSCLTFPKNPKMCHCPHCADEETKAPRENVTCQSKSTQRREPPFEPDPQTREAVTN